MTQRWTCADGDKGAEMWWDEDGDYVLTVDHEAEVRKWKDAPAATLPRLVVVAVIIRDGQVLLEKRAPAGVKGLDGMWDLPGGKVECGESPRKAIIREMVEEIGIEVDPKTMIPYLPISKWTYPDGEVRHWILAAYICDIYDAEPKVSKTLKWWDLDKLPKNILDTDLRLIQYARGK